MNGLVFGGPSKRPITDIMGGLVFGGPSGPKIGVRSFDVGDKKKLARNNNKYIRYINIRGRKWL